MLHNELDLIGKRLQDPIDLVRYHLYAIHSGAGKPGKFKTKFCYRVVVDSNFRLTIDPEPYVDENVLLSSYAVQYKGCPQDTSMSREYYFGDMSMSMHPTRKNPKAKFEIFSSNMKTPLHENFLIPEYMSRFKEEVSKDAFIKLLWDFICEKMTEHSHTDEGKKMTDIFIHFDLFEPLKVNNWHEIPGCIDLMDDMHIFGLKGKALQYNQELDVYALTKSLLPMVASGDKTNDVQFPGFDLSNRHKSFCLPFKDLRKILYHAKIMKALSLPLLKTKPYLFQIVPSGSYSTSDLIFFMKRIEDLKSNMFKKSEDSIAADLEVAEESIATASKLDVDDFLGDPATFFSQVINDTSKGMTSFDIILVRDGGNVMIIVSELNNLSRSSLLKNLKLINDKAVAVQETYKLKYKPNLISSFYSIHKAIKKGEKYQQKCIQFLLAAIRGMYYGDPILVELYLEHSLRNVRADDESDNFFMKIAFEFIESLNRKGPYMPQEQSGKIGEYCAVIACPVTHVIKSFQKSEIGRLDRRITKIDDVLAFASDVMEKITRHEGERYGKGDVMIHTDTLSYNLTKIQETIKEMEQKGIQFDPISFRFSFLAKLGKERFFSNKEKS